MRKITVSFKVNPFYWSKFSKKYGRWKSEKLRQLINGDLEK